MSGDNKVWWVNQGDTFGQAQSAGVIWAPILNQAGRTEHHWETLLKVRPGNVILHYRDGFIRAVGTALSSAEEAPNPFSQNIWNDAGRVIQVKYEVLGESFPVAQIPDSLHHAGPFTRNGTVKQGYLWPVGDELVDYLVRKSPEIREAMPWRTPALSAEVEISVDLNEIHQQFSKAMTASHLAFGADRDVVRSFLAGVIAKPLVVLSGLSGSGKTQLAMRLGDWLGHDKQGRPRYLVVPVRPDWTGPEPLLGYEDALRSAEAGAPVWSVPEALHLILRAAEDSTTPYLLILDEMNLAHVERYFADFLSGIESRQPILPDLVLRKRNSSWEMRSIKSDPLPLPRNLIVVGTINVDETTYSVSPKVLDRAWNYEFRVSSDALSADLPRPTAAPAGHPDLLRQVCSLLSDDEWQARNPYGQRNDLEYELREIHRLLVGVNFEFGHRVMFESVRFAAIYGAMGSEPSVDQVMDLILMQKILPRVHGSRRLLEPTLIALGDRAAGRWPLASAKLNRMLGLLRANQFVSFAE